MMMRAWRGKRQYKGFLCAPRPRKWKKRRERKRKTAAERKGTRLQLYRRYKGRESCTCQFSSSVRGGKPAAGAFPPFVTAVTLHLQLFLHCKRRKACIFPFSFASGSGLNLLEGPHEKFIISAGIKFRTMHGFIYWDWLADLGLYFELIINWELRKLFDELSVFNIIAWGMKTIKQVLLLFNSVVPELDINIIAERN